MAKPPVSGPNTAVDNLQTWVLRVYIHCEGCKKKVYKVLQSIDGVYKVVIESKEHTATVTGSVSGETLVQKLLKSGKHAEILPKRFEVKASDTGNQKSKKKSNNKNDGVTTKDESKHVKDKNTESEDTTTEGNDAEKDQQKDEPNDNDNGDGKGDGKEGKDDGGGKKKKNKKKKGEKKDDNAPTVTVAEGVPHENPENPPVGEAEVAKKNVEEASMEQLNLGHPFNPMVYATPYDLPPYHNNMYYPTPGYGVSYSTSYPSTESSYYTPPVYGYAQSHPYPSAYYQTPPPPSYYNCRSVFDDHDDEGEGKGYCAIM